MIFTVFGYVRLVLCLLVAAYIGLKAKSPWKAFFGCVFVLALVLGLLALIGFISNAEIFDPHFAVAIPMYGIFAVVFHVARKALREKEEQ